MSLRSRPHTDLIVYMSGNASPRSLSIALRVHGHVPVIFVTICGEELSIMVHMFLFLYLFFFPVVLVSQLELWLVPSAESDGVACMSLVA